MVTLAPVLIVGGLPMVGPLTWGADLPEEPRVQVSKSTPFAGSTADLIGGQTAPPIPNDEVKP